MSDISKIDPARTAILCMDCQNGIVAAYVKDAGFIPRSAGLLARARAAGVQVIHIRVLFRPGLPEVSARNPLFSAIVKNPQHQQLFTGAAGEVYPDLLAAESDIVIQKHRVSAFAGTDLAMILRAKDIDTLILFGIATSGVVLSTLLEACDADFRIFVISDCCADLDPDVHTCLMEKVFPRRATVLTAAQAIQT